MTDYISIIKDGGTFYVLLLIGITMHEFGHAFAADKLGDPLPRLQGRVTMNPIAHMDMLGTVVLPLLMIFISLTTSAPFLLFGWGKPVQVSLPNPQTRMRDDLISTAAGPFANVVLALISAVVLGLAARYGLPSLAEVARLSLFMNAMLFAFNMLPLPPLDGSHFLRYAVGMSDYTYARISSYSLFIFIVLINIPQFKMFMHTIISAVSSVFLYVSKFIAMM